MVHPITRSAYYDNYYGNMSAPKFTGTEEPAMTLHFGENSTKVSARNVGAFTPKYFQLERKTDNPQGAGFVGDLRCFDGKISGTLTNRYDQPVDDVAILMYNQMVLVGHMEAGQTVQLDGKEVVYGVMSYGYPMAEQITGASRYREGDLDDKECTCAGADQSFDLLPEQLYGGIPLRGADRRVQPGAPGKGIFGPGRS